jgi:4a-hydroxytetrahydrobiopterin dehydratase
LKKFTHQEIEKKLKEVPSWRLENEMIVRDWSFKDFNEAMKFINQIASLAEKHDHHPELFNVYNKVTVRFSTHDADGLTQRDFNIAKEIDNL